MKIKAKKPRCSGSALLMVLTMSAIALIILAGTLRRTNGVTVLNDRNNALMVCQNAAEAAVETVFTRMQYDFQSAGGPAAVVGNLSLYRTSVPSTTDDPYWGNFQFSDASGSWNGRTYVNQQSTYTGELPQAYPGRFTAGAPLYRIVSNARLANGRTSVVGTAQQDVLLALVPLTSYAIFYNDLLEFSTCATMTVNGPVHCNTNIYVGTGASLTFNTTVTTSGKISAPANAGSSWSSPDNYSTSWNTYFRGTPSNYIQNLPTITIPIPMTNSYSLIETPTTSDYTTPLGQQRLYNKAQVIVLVSNTTVTTIIQKGPTSADLPAADTIPVVYSTNYTSTNYNVVTAQLPFLTITNKFYDGRDAKTNYVSQVDIGKYREWISTNSDIVSATGKFPAGGGNYPTILYLADWRTNSVSKIGYAVRITNGIAPPYNGGQGFTLATPNPLYVWGNYNCSNSAYLGSTNTASAGYAASTVPSALMSDALTILSPSWKDSASTSALSSRAASSTTVNAAILTGIVPTTGTTTSTFSGGVHNLPRMLEDWSGDTLTINTSMINLFRSRVATNQFIWPGTTYKPPTRQFSYDLQFRDPTKVPPGMPCALVALRFGWATPPPNTLTYNVTP